MGFNIQAVPIFSVGEWNGKTFGHDDLHAMVSSYYNLKAAFPGWRPRLKVTHNDKVSDALLSGISAGEMSNFRVVSDFLVADFSNMPDGLRPFIENGSLSRRSIELSPYFQHKGSIYPNVVKACALLGSEMPAVGSLQDISKLFNYSDETSIEKIDYSQQSEDDVKCYHWEYAAPEGASEASGETIMADAKTFTQDEVQALIKAAVDESYQKQNEQLETKLQEFKSSIEADKKAEDEKKKKAAEEAFSKLAEEGKMIPAQVEVFKLALEKGVDAEALVELGKTLKHSFLGEQADAAKANEEKFSIDLDKCPAGVTVESYALNEVAVHFMSKDKELSLKDAMLKAEKSDEYKQALEA